MSCANALQFVGKSWRALPPGDWRDELTPDSQLSNAGVQQALLCREKAQPLFQEGDIDLFCSSQLTRAIETAIFAFPSNSVVHVIPGVCEKRRPVFDADNQPRSEALLRKYFEGAEEVDGDAKAVNGEEKSGDKSKDATPQESVTSNVRGLDLPSETEVKPGGAFSSPIMLKKKLNWELFGSPRSADDTDPEHFYQEILPKLIAKVLANNPGKAEVNIAIASHQHFIMSALKVSTGNGDEVSKGFANTSVTRDRVLYDRGQVWRTRGTPAIRAYIPNFPTKMQIEHLGRDDCKRCKNSSVNTIIEEQIVLYEQQQRLLELEKRRRLDENSVSGPDNEVGDGSDGK
jgi:broad specificity phosphatase PhoE